LLAGVGPISMPISNLAAVAALNSVQKLAPARKKKAAASSGSSLPNKPEEVHEDKEMGHEGTPASEIPAADADVPAEDSTAPGAMVRLVGYEAELKPKGQAGRSRRRPSRAAPGNSNLDGGDCG
jgi:hypothetical protein